MHFSWDGLGNTAEEIGEPFQEKEYSWICRYIFQIELDLLNQSQVRLLRVHRPNHHAVICKIRDMDHKRTCGSIVRLWSIPSSEYLSPLLKLR